jgi:hypothetical protein
MINMAVDFSVSEKGRKAPNWTLEADLNGELTLVDLLSFTKTSLIKIFSIALDEEQAKGFTKTPRIKVDGNFGKSIERVNPLGEIRAFDKQNVLEILNFIAQGVFERSRVKSGNYLKSHIVLFNGNLIAVNLSTLDQWVKQNQNTDFKRGDRFQFINVAPYARKLELAGQRGSFDGNSFQDAGRTRRRGLNAKKQVVNKPNGTYYRTYLATRKKFKQSGGRVGFTFEQAERASRIINAGRRFGRGQSPARYNFKSDGRPYVYPTITYNIDDRGIVLQ